MQRKRPLNSKYLNGIFPRIASVESHNNARPKFHFQQHIGSSRASQCTCNSSCSCPSVYQHLRYNSTADCNVTKTDCTQKNHHGTGSTQHEGTALPAALLASPHSAPSSNKSDAQSQTWLNNLGYVYSVPSNFTSKSLFSTLYWVLGVCEHFSCFAILPGKGSRITFVSRRNLFQANSSKGRT